MLCFRAAAACLLLTFWLAAPAAARTLPAAARTLKVLSGAGFSVPIGVLAAAYQARTGTAVTVVNDTSGGVQKRIEAGETYDLVITTQTVISTLSGQGLLAPDHFNLAQMVAGISMKAGSSQPAIADGAAVKATLLAARSIAYVDPAKGGITGVFFLSQADKLGVGAQVRAKAVLEPNGKAVAATVAQGRAQYGVTLVSEMRPNKGVSVWPLPADIQMRTIYAAAITTHAENKLDAGALLDDLLGPKGRRAAIAAGLKPVAPRD